MTPILVLLALGLATSGGLDFSFKGRGSASAVSALAQRVLGPEATGAFIFELVATCKGARPSSSQSDLCFELEDGVSGDARTVVVRGTSGPDLARGFATYLREQCNMSFAWPRSGGNQLTKPKAWPKVGSSRGPRWRQRDIAYGFNVVTFSYSHAWLPFENAADAAGSWVELLDWMVLHGCNLALAYTGQEEVYRKVYASFGVSDADFASWSNGPAHLAWSRGQSMHGVGGPLPLEFAKQQWALQRSILSRMRDLGLVPVLPAFQGNVPPVLASTFPTANITIQQAHWGGGRAAWLDATDPLFQSIGDELMATLIADFGIDRDGDGVGDETEHWYEADGYFAAGDPPWRRRALEEDVALEAAHSSSGLNHARPLAATGPLRIPRPHGYADDHDAFVHAAGAYAAINATDPHAIWLYQGWILGNSARDLEVIKAYVAATPPGKLIISDMWAEWRPIISTLAAAGCPWLYGALQNFGGTLFMGMSTEVLNSGSTEDPTAAPSVHAQFAHQRGGEGIGAFPEGTDQNPAYFTFLYDTLWADEGAVDMAVWWARYALERYGRPSPAAAKAWDALRTTVYGIDERAKATEGGFKREKAKGGLLAFPLAHSYNDQVSHTWYPVATVLDAWRDLAAAASELPPDLVADADGTFVYDLVNVGREVLDRAADVLVGQLAAQTNASGVRAKGQKLLALHEDADRLLCSCGGFSFARVLDQAAQLASQAGAAGVLTRSGVPARSAAASAAAAANASFFDRMARAQVTTWLPACQSEGEFAGGVCSIHIDHSQVPPLIDPPLEDYANKAWGGLVHNYYGGRVGCYVERAAADFASGSTAVNATAVFECIDNLSRTFQADASRDAFPMCNPPAGDAVALSKQLADKYGPLLMAAL